MLALHKVTIEAKTHYGKFSWISSSVKSAAVTHYWVFIISQNELVCQLLAVLRIPGVSVGVAGPSGSQFLMTLAFESALGVDLNIIPLGGGGPLMKALAGEHVDAGGIHSPMGLDYVIKGDMRLLVAGGPMDTVVYDKPVPTFEELNVPMEFSVYRGIFAPKGTPKDVVDKLAKAFEDMANDEKFIQFGKAWGVMPKYAGPEEFKKILDNDMETFRKVKEELIDRK